MDATDVLFEQLKESYRDGTLDDPVLKRAFEESAPNDELTSALAASESRARAQETQIASLQARTAQLECNHHERMEAAYNAHKQALKVKDREITRLIKLLAETPHVKAPVFAAGEAETLAELGWSKET